MMERTGTPSEDAINMAAEIMGLHGAADRRLIIDGLKVRRAALPCSAPPVSFPNADSSVLAPGQRRTARKTDI